MAEPEELIIGGAHLATRLARDAWRRYGPSTRRPEVDLASVRQRLELFLAALFGRSIAVAAAEPPPPATLLSRLARGRPPVARERQLLPATDGERIFLPPSLPIAGAEEDTLALYRLLAVQQAARLTRGTARTSATLESLEARDRFALAEAARVDRWIALEFPGLLPILRRARAEALDQRPNDSGYAHHPVEQGIRALLAADPRVAPPAPGREAPRASRYRRVVPVWYWGQTLSPSPAMQGDLRQFPEAEPSDRRPRVADMRRRPRVREAEEGEDDRGSGTWVIRADEPQESVEDPHGLRRPADRDDHADPDGLGDSLSDLPEARVVRTAGLAREVLRSGDEIRSRPGTTAPATKPAGIAYPEWDYRVGEYRHPGAIVRERTAALGDTAWVASALSRHGRLVRRVRARFERMQSRHVRLDRQQDGSEIDIDAFVTAAADLEAGVTVDGCLYVAQRPARRDLAVALLVDVSASTDAWVASNRRIIDVEKEALLIVCEALDALGDRYGIFAFSGEGAQEVSVRTLKDFHERSGLAVRRRIAALDSDRYTRMGAAIRHITGPLCREQADRRLLLVLSDGKPNDEDVYEGAYGVEDTRQAVAEARRQGVATFCLTIDRAAPRYAVRTFGRAGFAVLHRAEQLPVVVIEALRQLIRA